MSASRMNSKFSMIEIMIALAIIVLVMVGVVGMIPKSIESNQQAISRMSASDAADQFLNYFSSRLENNWNEMNALPETKYSGEDVGLVYSGESLISNTNFKVFFEAPSEVQTWDPEVTNTGIFKVRHQSGTNMVDFDGVVRVWKEATDYESDHGTPISILLHAEVSWPAHMQYEKRAKKTYDLKVYKPAMSVSEASPLSEVPCRSLWCIDGDALYYISVWEDAEQVRNKEGDLIGLRGNSDVEGLAIASDGTIYFINNGSGESELYKISTGEIDASSATKVNVTYIGSTGLSGNKAIGALQFVNERLYGGTQSSEEIYEIQPATAGVTHVGDLGAPGNFELGAMSVGINGVVYLTEAKNSNSEIWKFNSFPDGGITNVVRVQHSGALTSLAAHPGGFLYASDGQSIFKINPFVRTSEVEVNLSTGVEDWAFYYSRETNDCNEDIICETDGLLTGTISLNPTGNTDYEFEMTLEDGTTITRDDLQQNGATYDFDGMVTYVKFKPKSSGNQSDTTLDGEDYTLDNNTVYEVFSEEPFRIHIYNDNAHGHNIAMGHWLMDVDGIDITLSTCYQ